MQVKEIMTKNPHYLNIEACVLDAAKLMADNDFGYLPIEDNDKLVGMLTDRDITIRVVAMNKDPKEVKTKDVMSKQVFYCFEDDSVEDALESFSKQQINRMPVMDQNKRLVGQISLGDIARAASNDDKLLKLIGDTKESISER